MNNKPWKNPEPASNYFSFDNLLRHVKNNDLKGVANLLTEGAGSAEPTDIYHWIEQDLRVAQKNILAETAAGKGNFAVLLILQKSQVDITSDNVQRSCLELANKVGNGLPQWADKVDKLCVELLKGDDSSEEAQVAKQGNSGYASVLLLAKTLRVLLQANCDFLAWSGDKGLPYKSIGQALAERLPQTAEELRITNQPSPSPLASLLPEVTANPTIPKFSR